MRRKRVANSKEWNELGWLYRMSREVAGETLTINLQITKHEMHARYIVSLKVREARRKLMQTVLAFRLLEFT